VLAKVTTSRAKGSKKKKEMAGATA
jgi:hypothetical protein